MLFLNHFCQQPSFIHSSFCGKQQIRFDERERERALYKPQKPIIRNKLSNIIHYMQLRTQNSEGKKIINKQQSKFEWWKLPLTPQKCILLKLYHRHPQRKKKKREEKKQVLSALWLWMFDKPINNGVNVGRVLAWDHKAANFSVGDGF